MKSIFQKAFSIAMALFLLVSTVSWTIGMHYCGKSLVDIAFFEHAEKCGMDQPSNSRSESAEWSIMSCCAYEFAVIVGQDDLTTAHVERSIVQHYFFITSNTYYTLFDGSDVNVTSYANYLPPFLVRNVLLLHQVFII
ncbi:MAG: HYC_CC_PP family protein [Flavobacteriales bacterium]